MSTTTTDAPALLRLLTSLAPALRSVGESDPVFLSAAEKREALAGLRQCAELVKALELWVLGVASLGDDVCEDGAFRDVVALHAHGSRADRPAVAREVRLAQALEQRWQRVAEALRAGACSVAQAEVVVRALDKLPDDLPAEVLVRAEEHLVAECGQYAPRELRRIGRAVLEFVAPDVADAEEGRQLDREEQRAREEMSLVVRRCADGVQGRSKAIIKAPDAVLDRLLCYLDAFTAPRHQAAGQDDAITGDACGDVPVPPVPPTERVPMHRRRAQAFISLLECIDPKRLPLHGGDATSLIVTIDFNQLCADLGVGDVIGGDRISAAEARRLACTADILPMVLGGKSKPLDLGRSKRLYSRSQRKAMAVRDQTCRAEACNHPATWCEAHHLKRWSQGGRTDIDDGVLLCPFHHHRVHDDRYEQEWLVDRRVRFRRRRS